MRSSAQAESDRRVHGRSGGVAVATRTRTSARSSSPATGRRPEVDDAERSSTSGRGQEPTGDARPAVRVAAAWQSVWLAFLIALIVFCLLSSSSLTSTARSMPIGTTRSIALPVANGIDRVSNFLSLNRPADALNSALGREELDQEYELPQPVTAANADEGDDEKLPPLRAVTAAVPLEVMTLGDSMAQPLGQLLSAAESDGEPYRVDYEFKVSSGLARPDFYNWPARAVEVAETAKPEALVLSFGGNDAQEMTDPAGNVLARPNTFEWEEIFRQRVGGMMDVLKAENRRIVWMLPPRMRSAKVDGPAQAMHRIITEEARNRPWVLLVDQAKITSGPDGDYVDYLTTPAGESVDCRASDGVHLSIDCARLVTAEIERVINEAWAIGEPDTTSGSTATTVDGAEASSGGTADDAADSAADDAADKAEATGETTATTADGAKSG